MQETKYRVSRSFSYILARVKVQSKSKVAKIMGDSLWELLPRACG